MGSLFLAAKVEECGRAAKDVVNVFHRLQQKRRDGAAHPPPMPTASPEFAAWKEALLHVEGCILKELGFSLYSLRSHPHRYLPYFVQVLGGSASLAQRAFAYLNDSMRLDLCVRHKSETLACAALYMAARATATPLPMAPPWFALFSPTTSMAELQRVGAAMVSLYDRPKVTWLPSLRAGAATPATAAPPTATDATSAAERRAP